MSPRAVVVGGGVSGLTAAYRLSQAGWQVHLVEAREELGGLARSLSMGSSRIERYYHFVCESDHELVALAEDLGLSERLHWAPAPVAHWHQGTLYPFSTALDVLRYRPLSLANRLRMGLQAVRAHQLRDWLPLDRITAKDWLLRTAGPQVYELLWQSLLEGNFGAYHDGVSAAWMWHRLWRVGTSRSSLLRPDRMGYFDGGAATLLDALATRAQAAGACITVGCPATALRASTGRVKAVETAEGELEADAAILAVPLPVAARLSAEALPDWSRTLDEVPTLGVVCCLFRLKEHLTPYFWVNINDRRVQVNGLVEYSNLNQNGRWDSEILYVPMYVAQDDPRWLWSDEEWAWYFNENLSILWPGFPNLVVGKVITRDTHAQPICTTGFAKRVPPLAGPAAGLFLVEASQLYPSDRTLSGMIGLATKAAGLAQAGM